MNIIELDKLDVTLRKQLLGAMTEPIVLTENQRPVLVIRSFVEDDAADELIVQHPEFAASIRRARQQKAEGKVRRLAELREKYAKTEIGNADGAEGTTPVS